MKYLCKYKMFEGYYDPPEYDEDENSPEYVLNSEFNSVDDFIEKYSEFDQNRYRYKFNTVTNFRNALNDIAKILGEPIVIVHNGFIEDMSDLLKNKSEVEFHEPDGSCEIYECNYAYNIKTFELLINPEYVVHTSAETSDSFFYEMNMHMLNSQVYDALNFYNDSSFPVDFKFIIDYFTDISQFIEFKEFLTNSNIKFERISNSYDDANRSRELYKNILKYTTIRLKEETFTNYNEILNIFKEIDDEIEGYSKIGNIEDLLH